LVWRIRADGLKNLRVSRSCRPWRSSGESHEAVINFIAHRRLAAPTICLANVMKREAVPDSGRMRVFYAENKRILKPEDSLAEGSEFEPPVPVSKLFRRQHHVRVQWNSFLVRITGEKVLRQIWPVIGSGIIRADHRNATGISLTAQHFRRSAARGTASHDDYVPRRLRGTDRTLLLRPLLAHEELAAACFNRPAADRVKRSSTVRTRAI
jgi:hypothetical protein